MPSEKPASRPIIIGPSRIDLPVRGYTYGWRDSGGLYVYQSLCTREWAEINARAVRTCDRINTWLVPVYDWTELHPLLGTRI